MKFYVVSEVAEILRISESLVYSLIDTGKLSCHRFGNGRGKITISESDLQEYIVEPEKLTWGVGGVTFLGSLEIICLGWESGRILLGDLTPDRTIPLQISTGEGR